VGKEAANATNIKTGAIAIPLVICRAELVSAEVEEEPPAICRVVGPL
jgi:hypothetical protein